MSFWRRLFDRDQRAAEAAEAAGDLFAAADRFAKAGDAAGCARVKRRLAARAAPLEAVALLREAQADQPTDAGARSLAEALLTLAERQGAAEAAAGRLEAGVLLEKLGDDAAAAQAYEAAGAWQDAADSYAELGDIEAVERVIATGAAHEVAQLTIEGLRVRILDAAAAGRADRALEVLARARAQLPGSRAVAEIEAALEARLPRPGCLPLGDRQLVHGEELVIGRTGHVSAAIRGLQERHLVLRRAGSTLVGAAEPVEGRTRLELCTGCTLLLRPVPHGWSACLTLRGLAGDPVWWVDRYRFADGTEVVADGRWWRAGGRILLLGDVVGGARVG